MVYVQGTDLITTSECDLFLLTYDFECRVGVSGHALHGGYGFSSRNWGLALDSIQALHVILPDGRKVWASQRVQPDLFWVSSSSLIVRPGMLKSKLTLD